jgi:hypothetical protein
MYIIWRVLILLLIAAIALSGCGKSEDDPEPEVLLTMAKLMDESTDWLIILGDGEDLNGAATTDKYIVRYHGTDVFTQVKLVVNEVSYTLQDAPKSKYYYFSGLNHPNFQPGETYNLRLIADNVTKAECSIRMVDVPTLSTPTGFNSASDYNFQWQITENPMVQYVYGKPPTANQVIMALLGPTIRQYNYKANTLVAQTGTYDFGVITANYKVVNNIRFVTMSADWASCQQP